MSVEAYNLDSLRRLISNFVKQKPSFFDEVMYENKLVVFIISVQYSIIEWSQFQVYLRNNKH